MIRSRFLVGNPGRVAAMVLQAAVALWFVASAVGKLIDIDSFEVYFFSFGFVSLSASFLIARLVIVAELVLGVLLLSGIASRKATVLLLLLTIAFCCFLCYAEWIGRSDDCHCMGALASLPPSLSLLKNAVLIVLLLLLLRVRLYAWHSPWYVLLLIVVALTVSVFAISLPDNWMFGKDNETYNSELLAVMAEEGEPLQDADIFEGRKVVVMASDGCGNCRMALKKLKAIVERHDLDEDDFVVILASQKSNVVDDGVPMLQGRKYVINNSDFLQLTYGARPIILLMDDGDTVASYHARNIDENEIAQFLKQ